jgi:type IV pilus assembly protein PilA
MSSFQRATFQVVALLMISAFVVVGCGGGGKSEHPQGGPTSAIADFNAQRARGLDSEAKSNARNMVSQVESCSVDYSGNYTRCADLGNTGLPIGAGPGQVEVETASATYTVTAHSRTGNTFQLIKDASGTLRRTCRVRSDPGGCLGGTW